MRICGECRHFSNGWCFAGRNKEEYLQQCKDPKFDPWPTKPPEVTRDTSCSHVWLHDENFDSFAGYLILPDGRVAGGQSLSRAALHYLWRVGIDLKKYGKCRAKRITEYTIWLEQMTA
jgi:hypothetical protein